MHLDDVSRFGEVDSADMLGHIAALPSQCSAVWRLANELELPEEYSAARHVVVVGIGGSAIGGALLQGLVAHECALPITIVRDYRLPAFVRGPRYAVFGCSYSGDTEETLSAMGEAIARQVRPLAITTGGQLADFAERWGIPLIRYTYPSQPRAALGYSLILLLGACCRMGLVRDYSPDLAEAVGVMTKLQAEIAPAVPSERNAAKALAARIAGRLPVVYGSAHLVPVANRWKTQLNENAKYWAYFEPMPELQHNSVVGFAGPQPMGDRMLAIILRSALDHPRVRVRWDVMAEMLDRAGVPAEELAALGESRLSQMFSLILFGDYVSCYLALLHDVDPTPIDAISFLKARLAEIAREE